MSILEKVKEVGSNCVSENSNVLSYDNLRRAYYKDGKIGVQNYLGNIVEYKYFYILLTYTERRYCIERYMAVDKMISEIVREFKELEDREIRGGEEFFKRSTFGVSLHNIAPPLFSFTGTPTKKCFSESKFTESNIFKKAFVEFELEGRKVMVGAVSFKGSNTVKLGYSVCMSEDLENYKASISKKICVGRAIKKPVDSVLFGYSEKDILGDYGVLKSIANRTAKKIFKGDIVIKGIKPLKK